MPKRKIVIGAVIMRDENTVLLLQRTPHDTYPNLWELASGTLEDRETLLDALQREVYEETALKINSPVLVAVFEFASAHSEDVPQTIQINYRVRCDGGSVVISCEHQAYAWVPVDQLHRYEVSDETSRAIHAAVRIP